MANIEHKNITDPYLHEAKGVSTASNGEFYVADGAGSGEWHYLPTGWAYYKDNAAAQTITTTATKLSIDGAGSTSSSAYLPLDIRGTGELWDTTNDKITPIALGDQYDMRLDLPITAKSGSPTSITVQLDIGGGASPTISIVNRDVSTSKTPPYTVSMGFPIFSLATFIANGGQLFLNTDVGSVDITAPAIMLARNHGEELI